MYNKNTKIVCTLGPSSDSVTEIENLVHAGMNVARLNFSHGTYDHHKKMINNIRKVEKKTGRRIGILQDLQGPKIRIGNMPDEGIKVKRGETVTLTTKNIIGMRHEEEIIIPIQYKKIIQDVKEKDIIFIDDGLIKIQVVKIKNNYLYCQVKVGGIIKKHKGVNCPTASISAKAITPKDKKDLLWGLKTGIDFVALSFVKSKKDIEELRRMIEKNHKKTKIIAKIERHEAVKNLKEIMHSSDGVMVARGDLGIEIPAEKVPVVQKRIINLANKYGKPVITATQVLQSMVENARPTRAEISDAANAVFDHTDAIMLSNETAVGKYAINAARTLSRVSETIEKELQKDKDLLENIINEKFLTSTNATCLNACELALDSKSKNIIVYTEDGYTATKISKYRTFIPIITITPYEKVARELTLSWGIKDVFIHKILDKSSNKIDKIIKYIKKMKIVPKNTRVVIVCHASKKESLISAVKI